ncbi:ribonuclease H-like domain-containing protein [Tanacetum coccineum]
MEQCSNGQVPVNTAKQNSPRASTLISTARHVNTDVSKPKVNDALPITYSYFKAHSPVKRAFNQKSATKTYNLNEKVKNAKVNNVTTARPKAVVSAVVENGENVVKSSACWIWRLTGNVIDHTSKDSRSYTLKRFDYVDLQGRLNRCSRHMTRNKSFLIDYQEINGGFVAFGRSPKGGKITGKGKIRTGKLDFEDTECLVLSFDFKLLDESQVLLKVPRQNNMYSFDLKNIVPSGGLTYLFAKATIDESNLWHRRLGHINFKTMNKLVRGNLVEIVSTACYVHNRVLVTKPHNKIPYELLHGRPPSISFMRPFGYPVTILNTLDPQGKFDRKADEGFFVVYSINSKVVRVFNIRTRKVEENLHINFLENKPNVAGSGPDWLFDIDLLTNSMNYEPVTAGNQTNNNAGIKDNVDAVPTQQYIMLPLLYDSPQSLKDAIADDAGKKTNKEPSNKGKRNGQEKDVRDQEEALRKQFRQEIERLPSQGEATNTDITNKVNTVSSSVNAVSSSFTTVDLGRERSQRNEFESVFGQDKDTNGNNTYRMFTPVNAAGSSYENLS